MKKFFAILMALVLIVGCFASCGGNTAPDAGNDGEKVVRIGVFEPASGDSGAGGKKETLGYAVCKLKVPHC